MDQAGSLRKVAASGHAQHPPSGHGGKLRALAVASGKGGVGKTNIVANLAYTLNAMGKRALVFDADMGLGNVHILLGLTPKYNLEHVISGRKKMEDVVVKGPGGIEILPAGSGHRKYSELTGEEMLALKTELEVLESRYDFILFDIGAGISSNVMYFCSAASEVAVITSTEPTSFADAYAIMKVLSRDYDQHDFKLVVNNVKNAFDAANIHNRLERVAERFELNIRIDLLGHIPYDESVPKCVKEQRLFAEWYPNSPASQCVRKIAKKLTKAPSPTGVGWSRVFAL